ncbi:hypothetical protein [Lachnotalea glycerini]|uniref:Uncharacterized protein n=1 Tax=Lachnotalea glycerini TaxID=1763509 RepID=A0A371JBN1_9FIRM|nr:hypothetical protein [Lachnotalea glycerini]RDY30171.1 hypothetical protein CG710_016170 [Lachnotalea glycerini]
MVREPVTKEMLEQWKKVFEQYKDKLQANRKTGQELVEYITSKYEVERFKDEEADKVIYYNIMENEPLRSKLPSDTEPNPVTFYWNNNGNKVFIGVDLVSGFYFVEDDEVLWDELCAFQGLDEEDLCNYYCVAEYISCIKKFGMLEEILN